MSVEKETTMPQQKRLPDDQLAEVERQVMPTDSTVSKKIIGIRSRTIDHIKAGEWIEAHTSAKELMDARDSTYARRILAAIGKEAKNNPEWLSEVLNDIGTTHAQEGNHPNALKFYNGSLNANPNNPNPFAVCNKISTLYEMENYKDVVKAGDLLSRVDPQNPLFESAQDALNDSRARLSGLPLEGTFGRRKMPSRAPLGVTLAVAGVIVVGALTYIGVGLGIRKTTDAVQTYQRPAVTAPAEIDSKAAKAPTVVQEPNAQTPTATTSAQAPQAATDTASLFSEVDNMMGGNRMSYSHVDDALGTMQNALKSDRGLVNDSQFLYRLGAILGSTGQKRWGHVPPITDELINHRELAMGCLNTARDLNPGVRSERLFGVSFNQWHRGVRDGLVLNIGEPSNSVGSFRVQVGSDGNLVLTK